MLRVASLASFAPGALLAALGLAFGLADPADAAPAAAGRVEFEVLREGQPFGRQSVVVSNVDGAIAVETAADLKASLGPVTLFHYQQGCRETWRNGLLAGLRCLTVRDGRRSAVEASPSTTGLEVQAAKNKRVFPLSALPSTWWTKPPIAVYDMINTETGAPMTVRVSRVGREIIDAGGAKVEADHLRVQGTLSVDLWYDDIGHWIGCAFIAAGQKITYRLLTPVAEAPA